MHHFDNHLTRGVRRSARKHTVLAILVSGIAVSMLSGCTVISLVDAAASTAVGVTKATVGVTTTAVKGTAAVVGAVIPDGDDEKKRKK